MTQHLLPEKPLVVSPSLAATIGLEEACLLVILGDAASFLGQELHLSQFQLQKQTPFWTDYDIQRISKSLHDQGIIKLESAPYVASRELKLTFASGVIQTGPDQTRQEPVHLPASIGVANLIADNWQPDEELVKQLMQLGISREFIWEQLPGFIYYWKDRREVRHSWGSTFRDHVIHEWRKYEEDRFRKDQESPMYTGWRPSDDAMKILLEGARISAAFIEDSIPEFIIYWKERGETGRTWNSKFIQHVKRQWVRFKSSIEQDSMPRLLPEAWQPNKDVFDVLRLANIDMSFAEKLLPEFILFWRDSKQVHSSWNTKFLQHVKYVWAKQHSINLFNPQQVNQHAGQSTSHSTTSTRDRSLFEDLTDRSWAS
jgi:DnaT DNA-binding domain